MKNFDWPDRVMVRLIAVDLAGRSLNFFFIKNNKIFYCIIILLKKKNIYFIFLNCLKVYSMTFSDFFSTSVRLLIGNSILFLNWTRRRSNKSISKIFFPISFNECSGNSLLFLNQARLRFSGSDDTIGKYCFFCQQWIRWSHYKQSASVFVGYFTFVKYLIINQKFFLFFS